MSSPLAGLRWCPRSAALLAVVTSGVVAVFCALPVDRTGVQSRTGATLRVRAPKVGHALGKGTRAFVTNAATAPSRVGLPQLRHLLGALHTTPR